MEVQPATIAWGVLASGVAVYDMLCPPGQTLSEGANRMMETAPGRLFLYSAVGLTALHLVNGFQSLGLEHYDPFNRIIAHFRSDYHE